MLKVFAQILMALLMVYGFYCIIISVTYLIFRGEKEKFAVAIIEKENDNVDCQFVIAKRLFPVGLPIVILTDKDVGELKIKEIKRKYPKIDIYRTEKLKDDERSGNDN